MNEYSNNIDDYLRIGTKYYRIVNKPMKNDVSTQLEPWTKEAIKDDFEDKNCKPIHIIKKYTGFCFVPGHGEDFKEEINGFYNQYEKLTWQPTKGNCDTSLNFMQHIFGDQIELGLDYLTLLYKNPDQILPILCLVSEDRATGKSTFVKWVKEIWQGNMTINSNEEFRARFNADWITKLVIAVEETLLEKREDSERLKALSTGDGAKMELKGIDKREVPFYGKFILCSNNETNFIKIDQKEIRYWVRQIPTPLQDKTNQLDLLIDEIPAFLQFLLDRGVQSTKKSRMWFLPEDIETDALRNLKSGNRSSAEKEIETMVMDKMDEFSIDEIKMTLGDVCDELKNQRLSRHYINEVLNEKMNIERKNNAQSYQAYYWSSQPGEDEPILASTTKKGKFYIFKRIQFESRELYISNNPTIGKVDGIIAKAL